MAVYDFKGRRLYKGAPSLLTLLEELGEVDYDALLEKLVDKLEPLLEGKKYRARQHARITIDRLCERGLIERRNKGKHAYHVLTKKGKTHLARARLKDHRNQREPWDGKWRMLVFDIEEEHRDGRDKLRRELKEQGFARLQNSVWVYPFECYDYVALLKTSFSLADTVLYVVVEKLEDDEKLRRKFKLPLL